MRYVFSFLLLLLLISCKYVTYTPRTKRQQLLEKPSPLIFDRMVDFRLEQMGWPISKADFVSKGKKYAEVLENFPYTRTAFNITDSNNMIFTFSDHVKDVAHYKQTEKVDLNAYGGRVKFYREKGKFIWKLKMF